MPKIKTAPYRDRYSGAQSATVSAIHGGTLPSGKSESELVEQAKSLMLRGMSAKQKKVWLTVGPALVGEGRLKKTTAHAFLELCDVIVEIEELRKFRKNNSYSYSTEGRYGLQHKSFPETAQLNTLRSQFIQLCAHFGMTPGTDSKAGTGDGGKGEANPFNQL